MGSIIKAAKQARINTNKTKASEKYGTDVGSKFSSGNYAADEASVLTSENEGKRMFNGRGSYAKSGKDERFTVGEGTSVGKGSASGDSNVAGLFENKRQKLFS